MPRDTHGPKPPWEQPGCRKTGRQGRGHEGRGPAWSHQGAGGLRICPESPYLGGKDKGQLLLAAMMAEGSGATASARPSLALCTGHQVTFLYGPGLSPKSQQQGSSNPSQLHLGRLLGWAKSKAPPRPGPCWVSLGSWPAAPPVRSGSGARGSQTGFHDGPGVSWVAGRGRQPHVCGSPLLSSPVYPGTFRRAEGLVTAGNHQY